MTRALRVTCVLAVLPAGIAQEGFEVVGSDGATRSTLRRVELRKRGCTV